MTDLGALGGFAASRAWAINNTGQVVGEPAFLYDPDEGMMRLNDLIPPDSGWRGLDPRDINEVGQIVGIGRLSGPYRAFLMTPFSLCDDDVTDCQGNSIPDGCDIEFDFSEDCNANHVPDECDLADGSSPDCNNTNIPDECDIDAGTSADCNANLVPDECEPDCNGNGVPDDCDVDSDGDGVIDGCDGCPFDVNKTSPGVCGCNSSPQEDADDDDDGFLNCVDTCAGVDDAVFGGCEADEIPTMSAWGLVVMTLFLLVIGKVCFGRRSTSER